MGARPEDYARSAPHHSYIHVVTSSSARSSLGRSEKYFSSISISDTLFPLYFSILRQVCFLAFFDLRTPSFANFPVCVYIADLHGEVGQNILGS